MGLFRDGRLNAYTKLHSYEFIKAFKVMAGTDNNVNIHAINKHGLIYIIDIKTKELVTILHPRPSQLKRYWIQRGKVTPRDIKEIANSCARRNNKYKLNER